MKLGSMDGQRREAVLARFDLAPICANGCMMRCMGRRDSDSSPPIRLTKRCAAKMPESIRMVDPELPASSMRPARQSIQSVAVNAPPTPSCFSISRPSARMQAKVDWQSAPLE